jgi:ubiquinone biosynthesis O-methyltransferase
MKVSYFRGSTDTYINHLINSNLKIEEKKSNNTEKFDMITAMEVIEHVNNPNVFLKEINSLMKKNGILFMSTINKNLFSYLTTITIGENILGIIPKGTHDWEKYITLEQMENYLNESGFKLIDVKGCFYNILTEKMSLINNTSVNYILTAIKI